MSPVMEAESDSGTRSEGFSAAIRVLVVDDDHITLKIAEAMLRACNYEAVTVSRPTDALNMLYEKRGGFDLVLSDVHMPIMSGFELVAIVKKDFKIPVILFSADEKIEAMGRAMQCGACSYFVKPIIKISIQNLWQFVICKQPETICRQPVNICKQAVNRQRLVKVEGSLKRALPRSEDVEYSSSVNVKKGGQKEDKKTTAKRTEKEVDEENDDDKVPPKKARMVWTSTLHEKFVQAINHIGIKKAVPKKILQVMNIKGVSRTNIASHLQKYRLYLKGNKDPSHSSSKFWDPGYTPGLSQFYNQGVSSGNFLAQGVSRYAPSTRTLYNERNIQRQWMSSRNVNQQELNNLSSFESNLRNQAVDTSSYRTNYVGLQLCNKEGMIGVRQTGLNGGAASNFSMNFNQMDDISNGDRPMEAFENPPIPSFDEMNFNHGTQVGYSSNIFLNANANSFQAAPQFDTMNFNQATQVGSSSNMFVNPNLFQATSQIQTEEQQHQQHGMELDSWSEIIRSTSTNDLSNLFCNAGVQYNQENGVDGLIMDPQFGISEFQFDESYPAPMQM